MGEMTVFAQAGRLANTGMVIGFATFRWAIQAESRLPRFTTTTLRGWLSKGGGGKMACD